MDLFNKQKFSFYLLQFIQDNYGIFTLGLSVNLTGLFMAVTSLKIMKIF